MDFQIGQIIRMKKPHPCGGSTWELQRVGMDNINRDGDFRLKCQTCGHMVMIPRRVVEKGFRGFVEE